MPILETLPDPATGASPRRVHYETAGWGPRAVVLVHGNFASARWWQPVLDRVPGAFTAWAPSTRGCGESDGGDEFSIPTLARDLHAFTLAVGLDRFLLAGHSLGGAIATQYALDHPERVESLFLVSPAPTGGTAAFAHGAGALARAMRAVDSDDPDDLAALRTLLSFGELMGTNRRLLRAGLEDMLGRARLRREEFEALAEDACRLSTDALLGFLSALQHWDVRERMATLQVPVRLLWGEEDPLIPAEAAEATARAFPSCEYIVWRHAGHSPMVERPDAFAELLFGHEAFVHPGGGQVW